MIRDDTSRGAFEGGSYLPDRGSSCRAKRGTTNSDGRPSILLLSSPPTLRVNMWGYRELRWCGESRTLCVSVSSVALW